MTPHSENRVVAVRKVEFQGHSHISGVERVDGQQFSAPVVVKDIEDGAIWTMVPPKGAPAYEAYKATGKPLLLQARVCPDCTERVLYA